MSNFEARAKMEATVKLAHEGSVPCFRCKDHDRDLRHTIVCELCRGLGRIGLDAAKREIRLEAAEIGELEREMGCRKRALESWREILREAEFERFRK